MQPVTITTSIRPTAHAGGPARKSWQRPGGGDGDGAVVAEPTDRDQKRQKPADGGAAAPKRQPGEDDLGNSGADAGDAQRSQQQSAGNRTQDQDQDRVPNSQAEADQEGACEEGEEVGQRRRPDEEQLARVAVALPVRHRFEPT